MTSEFRRGFVDAMRKMAQEEDTDIKGIQDMYGTAKDIAETPYDKYSVEDLIRRDLLLRRLDKEFIGAMIPAITTGGLGALISYPIGRHFHRKAVAKTPEQVKEILGTTGDRQFFDEIAGKLGNKKIRGLVGELAETKKPSEDLLKLVDRREPTEKARLKNLIRYYITR